jgi:hypothetical protein
MQQAVRLAFAALQFCAAAGWLASTMLLGVASGVELSAVVDAPMGPEAIFWMFVCYHYQSPHRGRDHWQCC